MLATGSIGPVFSNDFRELRSNLANSTDSKIQAQDLFVYRPPLHPSQIRGCAIFDTCSIVNYPDVMDLSVANHVLIVVPFVVLKELDQLNKHNTNDYLRARSRDAMRRLRQVVSSRYVYLEDSSSSKARVSGFVASNNDERILSCAYRIQNELPPDCPHKIIFVTDDCNLQLKAEAHAMKCMSSEDYCKLMSESGIPEDPEEPMEIDSEPDPIPPAPDTSDMQALQKKDLRPPQMSREAKSEVRLVSCATQTSLEPVEGSVSETPVQLRNNKNGNLLACWPAVKDENSAAFCDKEDNNSDESRSAHYYLASAGDSPTVRSSRSLERSRPQSRLGYYEEQVVGRYDEKFHHGSRKPSRLCTSRDCSPPSDPYIHSSPISSRQSRNSFESVGDQANRYYSYDKKESIVYSHDSRSEDGLYKNEDYPAPPRRSRGRNRRRSGRNDGKYGTASVRGPIANDVPGNTTSSHHRSQESPCAGQKTNSSKDSSQSASELALMEFVDVWEGLVTKVIEKIELGNPSEKAKSDIRKLRDCAQQLCDSGELNHLKELVETATTLYYYYTFDPAVKNLVFTPAVLTGMLSLMHNRSPAIADKLVSSIMDFVTDTRILSC